MADVSWSPWRIGRFVFTRVIRKPIASGRLKDNGWPPGLKGIVVAWAAVYAVMAAAAVFSTPIRSHSPLLYDSQDTLPSPAVPAVTVALAFALSCFYTAGLHLVWWLRVLVTLVVAATLLRVVDWSALRPTDIALIVAAALLVVLLAARWGRAFHWLEFVASLLVIGHGLVIAVVFAQQSYAGYATDLRMNALAMLTGFGWSLAVPAVLVAGAAMAELTVATVAWTVTGVWQGLAGRRFWSPAWGIAAVAVLGVLRAVQVGWHVWRGDSDYHLVNVLPGMAILALVLAVCSFVMWRADRVRGGDPPVRPDPDDVTAHWSRWSMILALLLGVSIGGPVLVSNVFRAYGLGDLGTTLAHAGGSWQFTVLSLLAAAVALVTAFVLSGRGRRVAPLILAAAAWWVGTSLPDRANLLSSEAGISIGASLAALAVFGWLVVRRRMSAVRGVALATVLVLSGVIEYRDVLDEPLTAVFSLVGVTAAVLVGLVWRMLTDSGYSRGDSSRFPRASRVLVSLASTVYAVTSIAVVSLIGGRWAYDIGRLESAGDTALGLSLACVAFYAGLSLAARGRLVRPSEPRDDYGKLLPGARA